MDKRYAPTMDSSLNTKMWYLIEEAGEVAKAAGKAGRFGLESKNPLLEDSDPAKISNRDKLLAELADLKYAITLVEPALQ